MFHTISRIFFCGLAATDPPDYLHRQGINGVLRATRYVDVI